MGEIDAMSSARLGSLGERLPAIKLVIPHGVLARHARWRRLGTAYRSPAAPALTVPSTAP